MYNNFRTCQIDNFTSRLYMQLAFEEIAPRAEEMAGEKDMACCVRGHVYKDIWAAAIREVLVCSTEPINVGKMQNYIRVKYFRTFFVYKNIFTTKIKQITDNMWQPQVEIEHYSVVYFNPVQSTVAQTFR